MNRAATVPVFAMMLTVLVSGQDEPGLTVLECLENLQNDFHTAIAHGSPSYEERVKVNEAVARLGAEIGEERGHANHATANQADTKKLKAEIKSMEKLMKSAGFSDKDRAAFEKDSADLEHAIEHGPPVFKGYRPGPH